MFEELLTPYWDAIKKVMAEQDEKQRVRELTQEKILAELTNMNYSLDQILKVLKARK